MRPSSFPGYGVRISGEDVGRGTFFHRHAAFHDPNRENWNEGTYYTLQQPPGKTGRIPVLRLGPVRGSRAGFDYGYASPIPTNWWSGGSPVRRFANGAQVVIDQFISSGAKWGRACGLVMLLPHGYEGQGPERSSARLSATCRRAPINMEVCVPTTPAQVFHMLRRQAVRMQRKPLIVMSPKSPCATGCLLSLASRQWRIPAGDRRSRRLTPRK